MWQPDECPVLVQSGLLSVVGGSSAVTMATTSSSLVEMVLGHTILWEG